MKGFRILSTILVLANFCKSAWGQRPLADTEVKLTEFSWTFDNGQVSDVTVCADDALGTTEDEYVYSLSYRVGGKPDMASYDKGTLNKTETTCVSFGSPDGQKLVTVGVTYSFFVTDNNNEVVHHGAAHFAVLTTVLTRDCDDPSFPLYYRIEGPPAAVFEGCLEPSYAGDNVCYKDYSDGGLPLTKMNICYTDVNSQPPNLKICQKGLEDTTAIVIGDPLQIDYLAYGGESSTSATVMLKLLTAEISEVFVVAETNKPAMCDYVNGLCTIEAFTPQNIKYHVCGLATETDSTQFTSVGSIQDFDVFIYADTGLLLDFGFANANKDVWLYTATLLDEPEGSVVDGVESVTIDCTKVESTHNCYGFLVVEGSATEGSYLKVSYYSETEPTEYNTVIVPHKQETPIAITAEQPETKIN